MDHLIQCMGCMEFFDEEFGICPFCGYEIGTPPEDAYHMATGTILKERYIVGRVLGFGGFGVTYIGYDPVLERKIAIKEYLPGEFATRVPEQRTITIFSGEREEQFTSGRDKFIDEAQRLAKLKNVPGIVEVFDVFMENQTAYIVMELLEGETLKEHLNRETRMEPEEAKQILLSVLAALKEVHKIGIIHRDIAPDNIFLTKSGEVKILDFGAARYATTQHSKSLSVILKQGYAPVEQYRSKGDQGPWTDVYAAAATFYRMITGTLPEDAMERSAGDKLIPPSKLGITLTPAMENAVMNALNIKIVERTASAEQFIQELNADEVIRVKQSKDKLDIGKWPMGVKAVIAAGFAAIILFLTLLSTGVIHFDRNSWGQSNLPEGKTRVPNLINEELPTAQDRSSNAELILQILDKQYSADITENKVLAQTLKSGLIVDEDGTLGIVVSAGIEKTYVPNVIGLIKEEAVKKLESAGLKVRCKEEEYEAAPGSVGEQSLEAGTETDTGTKIELLISLGLPGFDGSVETAVADISGLPYEEAKKTLIAQQLYILKSKEAYSDSVPEGEIIEQDPKAGSTVFQNTNVNVTVSLGKEQTRVPDIQYKTKEDAQKLLKEVSLEMKIEYEDSETIMAGNVIRQDIEAGSLVEMGTVVTAYISNGNARADNSLTAADAVNRVQEPSTQGRTEPDNTGGSEAQSTSDLLMEESRKQEEAREISRIAEERRRNALEASEEAARRASIVAKNKKAEEEAAKRASMEAAERESEEAKKASEDAAKKASEDAAKKASEEAARKASEEEKRKALEEEQKRAAEEAKKTWSDWTEDSSLRDNSAYLCETKEQYRYRTRQMKEETKVSSDAYLDGWELVNTTEEWGSMAPGPHGRTIMWRVMKAGRWKHRSCSSR